MAFWTGKGLEPRRSYRFRLGSISGLKIENTASTKWWNAKKVDKPSFSVSSNKYRLINHEINMPGIVSWNPITIELADVGDTVKSLLEQLKDFGYSPRSLAEDNGLSKSHGVSKLGDITIEQLNGAGATLETWKLEGAYMTELRFGNLDYASDDIITLNMTITYDYAYLDTTETE